MRCRYCDFATTTGNEHLADSYLDAIERELRERSEGLCRFDTVFVGGGTPSLLDERRLERLCEIIAPYRRPEGEWTFEANPESLDAGKARLLLAAGIDRFSVGVQSFDDDALRFLGRPHDAYRARRAFEMLGELGAPRRSLDLIHSYPGQTLDAWRRDLETAVALAPDHISAYALIYEEGTPLHEQRRKGLIVPLEEEAEVALFDATRDLLESRGLAAYEISNFARPGQECLHNLVYWLGHPYLGVGVGAASYLDGVRTANDRGLGSYLRRMADQGRAVVESEQLDRRGRAGELLMLRLRLLGGFRPSTFLRATGHDVAVILGPRLDEFLGAGLLARRGDVLRLTRDGARLSSTVCAAALGEEKRR